MSAAAPAARNGAPLEILLVDPANTLTPHKTFEPGICSNLGLLPLASPRAVTLRRMRRPARVLYYDAALPGDGFIGKHVARSAGRPAVIGDGAGPWNCAACGVIVRQATRDQGAACGLSLRCGREGRSASPGPRAAPARAAGGRPSGPERVPFPRGPAIAP